MQNEKGLIHILPGTLDIFCMFLGGMMILAMFKEFRLALMFYFALQL